MAVDGGHLTCRRVGDLVWAKMTGYPSWPGAIIEPLRPLFGKQSHVYFFGTHNHAFIDEKNIVPHSASRLATCKPKKLRNRKLTKAFEKAVTEIENASKNAPGTRRTFFSAVAGAEGVRPHQKKTSSASVIKKDPNPAPSTHSSEGDNSLHSQEQPASKEEEDRCSICLEIPKESKSVYTPCCKQRFHRSCLLSWIGQNALCPLCRKIIKINFKYRNVATVKLFVVELDD